MNRMRELLFGNWRNKGVALFFAVTIWFVVFQAEKKEFPANADVALDAENPEFIITRLERLDEDKKAYVEFNGRVKLDFSGPRKQIEDLRKSLPVKAVTVAVPPGAPDEEANGTLRSNYTFDSGVFGFPRNGIDIVQFSPKSIRVTQEKLATREITNLERYVDVVARKDGFEVGSKKVNSPKLVIRGPESVINNVQPRIEVSLDYSLERFKRPVRVRLVPESDYTRMVTVEPSEVDVEVVSQAGEETLAVGAVRVTFRMLPPAVPVKILVDNMTGGSIPVEFHGPKDRIAALKDQLEDPSFSLGVRVRPFDFEDGVSEQSFTETDLELYGFPEIQKRPHESRDPPIPWTYRVVAVKEKEG